MSTHFCTHLLIIIYLFKSLSIFADRSPFSFLMCTKGFFLLLIHLTRQGFSTLIFWISDESLLLGAVHCKIFSIISELYPLPASGTPHPSLSSRYCQISPGKSSGRRKAKLLSVVDCWSRGLKVLTYQRINFDFYFFLFLVY